MGIRLLSLNVHAVVDTLTDSYLSPSRLRYLCTSRTLLSGRPQMVSWLCNLEVTDDLVSRLEALADRHVEYGCLPAHCKSAEV